MTINMLFILSELNRLLWEISLNNPEYRSRIKDITGRLEKELHLERDRQLDFKKKITKQYGNERNN
jgi:hypothetical protein